MTRKVISYKLWVISLITLLTCNSSPITNHYCFAQNNNKLVNLSKQIIEAKTDDELYLAFEELTALYFSRPAIKVEGGIPPLAGKENKYNELTEFLKSLSAKKKTLEPFVNYYIALTRYHQLKYLEETQSWDEYFSQGNTYRDQITEGTQNAISSTTAKDTIHLWAKLILWRFHKDSEDTFQDAALEELMNSSLEYSKGAKNIAPIREVADQLLSYGQRGKSKELYKVYVDRLITSEVKDEELKNIALGFYKARNLELAQSLYDVYIERLSKTVSKEKLIPSLIEIAKAFSYREDGPSDAFYAEKVFKKIEDIGGKDAFDEQLLYLRAFNLEKAKEYLQAKENYVDLVTRYPKTTHADEADFKVGIIYTYVDRDIKTGRSYFEKLAQRETLSPQIISSLYQLGLLSQWEEDLVLAKEYYNKLLEKAKDGYQETVTLSKERLKECAESKPIEYNLKTFLDVSLKDEYIALDMTKLDLSSSPYRAKIDEGVTITSSPYVAESGCFQVEVQYLWSGHIGKTKPSLEESTFNTHYPHAGTKEINLVVVSPTGILERNLDMVDIY